VRPQRPAADEEREAEEQEDLERELLLETLVNRPMVPGEEEGASAELEAPPPRWLDGLLRSFR